MIKNVCDEDVAEYSCVAKNVRGKTHLELNAKESLLAKLPEVKAVSKGQNVKLTCYLNGPVDKVQWYKRGKFLVDEKSKYTKYSIDRGKHKCNDIDQNNFVLRKYFCTDFTLASYFE